MFPASSSADLLGHQSPYDFTSGENEGKWKGIFVAGLKKVRAIKDGFNDGVFNW